MTERIPPDPVLVVDDEEDSRRSFELSLKSFGLTNILLCADSLEVRKILQESRMSLILLDLTMPRLSGDEVLLEITATHPEIPVVVVTGKNDLETAVRCMQAGAVDYLLKPVERNRLRGSVMRHLEFQRLQMENLEMKRQLLGDDPVGEPSFAEIVTQNRNMLSLFKYVRAVAPSGEPILITGETGVGKELLAHSIHRCSGRSGEFVSVNVAGLDDTVFSDTLFGHKKGAFTDAFQSRSGLVEKASRGTLFLDEIGDLSIPSQIKLLRLLQENEYYPLGADVPQKAAIRVVTSTNTPIDALRNAGHFRRDLFYRLYIHHIHIPPLRQRLDDIPLLVNHFIEAAALALKKKKPGLPIELLSLLMSHDYPGNIRELRGMIFDAVSTHRSGSLSMKNFQTRIGDLAGASNGVNSSSPRGSPESFFPDALPTIQEAEAMLIRMAMEQSADNQTIASQLLGIARQTLNRKLKALKQEDGP